MSKISQISSGCETPNLENGIIEYEQYKKNFIKEYREVLKDTELLNFLLQNDDITNLDELDKKLVEIKKYRDQLQTLLEKAISCVLATKTIDFDFKSDNKYTDEILMKKIVPHLRTKYF